MGQRLNQGCSQSALRGALRSLLAALCLLAAHSELSRSQDTPGDLIDDFIAGRDKVTNYDKATLEQARYLFNLVLMCTASSRKAADFTTYFNLSSENDFVLRARRDVLSHAGSTTQDTNYVLYTANLNRISQVSVIPGGVRLGCYPGKNCVAELRTGLVCAKDDGACKHAITPPRSLSKVDVPVCVDQRPNAVLALKTLIERARYLSGKSRRNSYSPSNLPADQVVPIRTNPDRNSSMVAALPSTVTVLLNNCRTIQPYNSKWCGINFGKINGWISTSMLQRAP